MHTPSTDYTVNTQKFAFKMKLLPPLPPAKEAHFFISLLFTFLNTAFGSNQELGSGHPSGKVHRASMAAKRVRVNCLRPVCPLKGNCRLFHGCPQTQLLTPTSLRSHHLQCLYTEDPGQKLAFATLQHCQPIASTASVAKTLLQTVSAGKGSLNLLPSVSEQSGDFRHGWI